MLHLKHRRQKKRPVGRSQVKKRRDKKYRPAEDVARVVNDACTGSDQIIGSKFFRHRN
jgi:hypothetical protein